MLWPGCISHTEISSIFILNMLPEQIYYSFHMQLLCQGLTFSILTLV